jgi:hypothetical protein
LEYASPSVATGVPNFGLHKVTFREIFIFKNSGHERIRLGSNPPPQFGQQSCIKEISVPETKATLVFILADFLPVNPMDLSSIRIASPPEPACHTFQVVTNTLGEKETTHDVGRYSLNDCFN